METLSLHSPAQLSAHLKSLRKMRKLTQAQLAGRLGIRQSRLADIENHPETVSSAQLLDLLAALERPEKRRECADIDAGRAEPDEVRDDPRQLLRDHAQHRAPLGDVDTDQPFRA